MGNSHRYNYSKESKDEKEYNKLCKKYKFYKGDNITVKNKEKFGLKFSANYTIPPKFQVSTPIFKKSDKEIKLIQSKSYYHHPIGTCGGDDVDMYIFEATKKGTFKIEFSSHTITIYS